MSNISKLIKELNKDDILEWFKSSLLLSELFKKNNNICGKDLLKLTPKIISNKFQIKLSKSQEIIRELCYLMILGVNENKFEYQSSGIQEFIELNSKNDKLILNLKKLFENDESLIELNIYSN